jgi:hypothetical protein
MWGMFSLKSIAFRCVKICVYMLLTLAYLKLGGSVYWLLGAVVACGWFYILRQAWQQRRAKSVNPPAPNPDRPYDSD